MFSVLNSVSVSATQIVVSCYLHQEILISLQDANPGNGGKNNSA